MCDLDRHRSPRNILRVGMAFLAVALIAQRFIHPSSALGEDAADGIRGLFFGLSIGLNLLAIRIASRSGWGGCAR